MHARPCTGMHAPGARAAAIDVRTRTMYDSDLETMLNRGCIVLSRAK